jgi:hypothetical protein
MKPKKRPQIAGVDVNLDTQSPEDRAGTLAEMVLAGEATRSDLAELRRLCRGNARCTDAAVIELLIWAAPAHWARMTRDAAGDGSQAA